MDKNVQLFDKSSKQYVKEAASLLVVCFPYAYSDCAFKEIEYRIKNRLLLWL